MSNTLRLAVALLTASLACAQKVETVPVVSQSSERSLTLPGEFLPFQTVEVHARVPGYVDALRVDRGTAVSAGQVIATLRAPELAAQVAEAESKVQTAESQRAEAEARLLSAQSTFDRLKAASATPGAIAGNEIVVAEKGVDAARSSLQAMESAIASAKASAQAVRELSGYLRVTAPFAGTVTERYLHPGALAGPSTGPLVRIEQANRLRLVVAVPETAVGGIARNAQVTFTVPAYPGETFRGTVARVARTLDPKTRTMSVEADVQNPKGRLAPGMYPEVTWPVRTGRAALLVPPGAVVTTTEKAFVIRVVNGRAEHVSVVKAGAVGELLEVRGPLRAGDVVVRRATDEIRPGAKL